MYWNHKFMRYLPFLSSTSRFVLLSLSIVLTPFPFVLTLTFNITYLIRLLYVTKVTFLLSCPHAAALLHTQAPTSLPGHPPLPLGLRHSVLLWPSSTPSWPHLMAKDWIVLEEEGNFFYCFFFIVLIMYDSISFHFTLCLFLLKYIYILSFFHKEKKKKAFFYFYFFHILCPQSLI